MRKSRFTETQIVSILKEAEAGRKVEDVCREHGISNATYYQWKSKYGGMEASDLKRMKELEAENSKRVDGFLEVLGKENVSVYDFDTSLNRGGFVKSFGDLLGVNLVEPPRENESMTMEALSLMYAFIRFGFDSGTKTKLAAREQIVRRLIAFYSTRNGYTHIQDLDASQMLADEVKLDVEWLNTHFSIDYRDVLLPSGGPRVGTHRLPNAADLDVSTFFERMQIQYDRNKSLRDHFERLFVKEFSKAVRKTEIDGCEWNS